VWLKWLTVCKAQGPEIKPSTTKKIKKKRKERKGKGKGKEKGKGNQFLTL
jgi:hypothetical protein